MKTKIFTFIYAIVASMNLWAADSGRCGDNLTWTLDNNGTLTISGTGSMTNYNHSPWYNNSNVKKVIINAGVTSIGEWAFWDCSGLTSVTIPNSVASIGNGAFSGCKITSINYLGSIEDWLNKKWRPYQISSNYTLLLNGAKQTSITTPNNVTNIGEYAFFNCSSLTSVIIPNSVTSIGNRAFYGCSSLTTVILNSDTIVSKSYTSSSNIGNIFGTQVKEYIIGDGVTSIGDHAFYSCDSLKFITIGNSVTNIGDCAFSRCRLTSVTIPGNVKKIGNFVFSKSALKSVTIENGITDIGDYAFMRCRNLSSINIPNSVNSIGTSAFSDCIRLPIIDNIRYADTYLVEAVDKNLSNYTIKSDTKWIGSSAFSGCTSLKSVTIPDKVTIIGWGAFYGCISMTSVTIPNSVTYIGAHAFDGCSSLTSVTIPNSVTGIDWYAFSNCSSLTSVTISNSVTSINWGTFMGCSSLTYVSIPNSVTSIEQEAFYNCSGLTSVTIGNSVTSIGRFAFERCSNLTSVFIPNSVTLIDVQAFSGCSALTEVTFESANPCIVYGGNFDGTYPIYVPCGSLETYKQAWKDYADRLKYKQLWKTVITIKKVEHGNVEVPDSTCSDDVQIKAIPDYGYHFVRWSDGNTDTLRIVPNEEATYTAEFAINEYTVTFVDWDGKVLKSEQVKHGKSATAPAAPQRDGYRFIGWDKDFSNVQSDLKITAQYTISTYIVVFQDWDERVISTQEVEHGKSATAPADPQRDGYRFIGWDKDFTNIQSDLTTTALYEQIEDGLDYHIDTQHLTQPTKVLIDGAVYILMPDGRRYNLQGAEVK